MRIRTRLQLVEQLHIRDIVDVDPFLKNDDQPTAIQLHGEDGRLKTEFADC